MSDFFDFEGMLLEGAPVKLKAKGKASIKAKPAAKVAIKSKTAPKKKPAPRKPAPKKPAPKKPAPKKPALHVKGGITGQLQAKLKAAVQPIKAKVQAAKLKPVSPAQKAKVSGADKPVLTQAVKAAVRKGAAQLPQVRTAVATDVASKMAGKIAAKAGIQAKAPSPLFATQKAIAAVQPIATACKCDAKPVIRQVDANLACTGFPVGTAKNLFARFHDMSQSVEKAANQRLATYEHKRLSSEEAFRCQVLRRLQKLARCLPECHPARVRTNLAILKGT